MTLSKINLANFHDQPRITETTQGWRCGEPWVTGDAHLTTSQSITYSTPTTGRVIGISQALIRRKPQHPPMEPNPSYSISRIPYTNRIRSEAERLKFRGGRAPPSTVIAIVVGEEEELRLSSPLSLSPLVFVTTGDGDGRLVLFRGDRQAGPT